jgi:hypothetical protein
VAARDVVFRSAISASRRTPAYIGLGFEKISQFLNFRIILIP